MCLAMPARVIEAPDPLTGVGRVDAGGARGRVNLGLLDQVAVGDWVLVQMGIAVQKVDEDTAREIVELVAALQSPAVGADAPGEAREEDR